MADSRTSKQRLRALLFRVTNWFNDAAIRPTHIKLTYEEWHLLMEYIRHD